MKTELTHDLIKRLLHYDPETGIIKRIGRLKAGTDVIVECDFIPTAKSTHGYLQIRLLDKTYDVHRLIYYYMAGSFPPGDIDHINGDRLDNRWENIRVVSRGTNLRNQGVRKKNKYDCFGIFQLKNGKFWTYINKNNIRYTLGYFDDLEEAKKTRLQAEKDLDFHPNHGKRLSWARNQLEEQS